MTIPNDGSYYAEGRTVFKAPLREPREDGGADITIGFPVCTASEWVTKEAPQTIADALNAARSPALEAPQPDPRDELLQQCRDALQAAQRFIGTEYEMIADDGELLAHEARPTYEQVTATLMKLQEALGDG